MGDVRRQRTRAFTELQSHYLFEDRFGRPGKGKVEGMVGYVRRNFLAPVPSFASFEALNAHLEQRCRWPTGTGMSWSGGVRGPGGHQLRL